MQKLTKFKELCDAATPGKMVRIDYENSKSWFGAYLHPEVDSKELRADFKSKADLEVFLASRTAMPVLIEVVEVAEAALDKIAASDNELSRWAIRAKRDIATLKEKL